MDQDPTNQQPASQPEEADQAPEGRAAGGEGGAPPPYPPPASPYGPPASPYGPPASPYGPPASPYGHPAWPSAGPPGPYPPSAYEDRAYHPSAFEAGGGGEDPGGHPSWPSPEPPAPYGYPAWTGGADPGTPAGADPATPAGAQRPYPAAWPAGPPAGGAPPGGGHAGWPPPPGPWGAGWSSPPGGAGWPGEPPGGAGWPGEPPGGAGGPGEPPGHDPYWNPQPPRRRSAAAVVITALVALAVIVGIGIGHTLPTSSNSPQAAQTDPGSGSPGTTPGSGANGNGASPSGGSGPADVSGIAAKISPSLVDINTDLTYNQEEAAGTGMILSSGGLVLTNNHVIAQATSVTVTDIASGKRYTGVVLGYDLPGDVAVVQMIGAHGLTTAPIDTSGVSVGEGVVAVGNAGGRGGTPTAAGGTITALDQSITASDEGNGSTEQLSGLIQTDADVQAGDSGGSLVDSAGQVIGMDTAASDGFSFATTGNEGFAIPIRTALRVVDEIQAHRSSTSIHVGATAFIGVEAAAEDCTGNGAQIPSGSGALVCKVVPGTAAQRSGLATDDVITSLGGKAVTSPTVLTHLLLVYHPGDRTVIAYTNAAGQRHTATVTFGSGPPA